MDNIAKILSDAGLENPAVAEYVAHWAGITEPAAIEVISAKDDDRLIAEGLATGEIAPAGDGLYYSRSYYKDTARSEERTVVATHNPQEAGIYNNWHDATEVTARQLESMKGASRSKTMYVVPYLMAPPKSPLEKWARGVELTDNLTVVLHMIRMARVGVEHLNNLENPAEFVRAVHVTGDLKNLGQGTDKDKRLFATVADERTILHFGSSYGGNALLGKIAHGLRQASYDGWASGEFLSEQFMLIGIKDKLKDHTYY
ncbi:MAG: phosphoenolpyruvate carboxykinase, partial [Varibaculum cambriense]|nr:phosphoenolpyruvate carboxykinase [Varibaculum cambriense]